MLFRVISWITLLLLVYVELALSKSLPVLKLPKPHRRLSLLPFSSALSEQLARDNQALNLGRAFAYGAEL